MSLSIVMILYSDASAWSDYDGTSYVMFVYVIAMNACVNYCQLSAKVATACGGFVP